MKCPKCDTDVLFLVDAKTIDIDFNGLHDTLKNASDGPNWMCMDCLEHCIHNVVLEMHLKDMQKIVFKQLKID